MAIFKNKRDPILVAFAVIIGGLIILTRFYPFTYNTLSINDKGRYTIGIVTDYEDGFEGKQPVFKFYVNGKEYRKRIRPPRGSRGHGLIENSPHLIYFDHTKVKKFVTGDHYFIKFSVDDPQKCAIIISSRFIHHCLTKEFPKEGWEEFPFEEQPCEKY